MMICTCVGCAESRFVQADGKIYVILDMHCSPGGQTGANIDNMAIQGISQWS